MTVKEDQHLELSKSTRVCEKCGEEKQLCKDHFYFKKDRGDFDKVCTICRKKARRSRYQEDQQHKEFPVPQKLTLTTNNPIQQDDLSSDDLHDLISFFEVLKEWRDEFKESDSEKFNKKWEVSNV